jgi:hypothetical protein
MLHHAEPKLFFCLMHIFELFEFEFGVCLNLNSKEKKGLDFRKQKRKTKEAQPPSLLGLLAQTGPASRPRTHPHPLIGGPHLSASCLARLLSLPSGAASSAPWPIARSRVVSLSCGPHLPVTIPSFNRPPARTVGTHAETVAPTSPLSTKPSSRPPLQVPARIHFPPVPLTSPLHTHTSCARPFFHLTRAPPSPGFLRPIPPPARSAVSDRVQPPLGEVLSSIAPHSR